MQNVNNTSFALIYRNIIPYNTKVKEINLYLFLYYIYYFTNNNNKIHIQNHSNFHSINRFINNTILFVKVHAIFSVLE